ncbi:MAG: ABC transporter permease, partial [Rhodothermaceae bacterium]|nr:ABC transporter permease [Rhodothermaceae bacterium]
MQKPPTLATLLLGWVLHPVDREIVLGDLEEVYAELLTESGKLNADGWYWSQTIRSFFPLLFRSFDWYIIMFFHYMKIGLRSLRKQAAYAATNLIGLSVGLACVLLIALFVRFELSYDRFHTTSDRLYRIIHESPSNAFLGNNTFAVTPGPLATALPDEFPEVEHATQLFGTNLLLQHLQVQSFADGMYATPDFFKVFTFPLSVGDTETALDEPNSIVLTESLSKQFFRNTNPVGQTIKVKEGKDFIDMTITGIAEDPPANSHLAFSYVISASSTRAYTRYADNWDSNNYLTYATLKPNQSLDAFTEKLSQLARTHLSQYEYYVDRPEDIPTYKVQSVVDIHLHSDVNFEFGQNGDIRYVYLFSVIAISILLIAGINYINLATARSFTRTVEVGVRQVLGARRPQLIGQFMGESVVPAILSLCIALLLVQITLPVFNSLVGRDIALSLFSDIGLFLVFVAVGITVGLLAGSYPALNLTRIKTVRIIRGVLGGVRSKARLRSALVVLQFTISIALLISALVIRNQIEFVQSQQTGVDRDQVISVQVRDKDVFKNFSTLKETLLQDPRIRAVTAAGHDPTNIYAQSGTSSWDGAQEGQQVSVYNSPVQPGYVEALG